MIDEQEKITILRRLIDRIWIPFLNLLPEDFGHAAFKESSFDGSQVSKHATTYRALEILYNWDRKFHFKNGLLDGFFTYIWQCTHNVQAVRNRKKIVVWKLRRQSPDMIVSLGSGSARAVFEYLRINESASACLIDFSDVALIYSRQLAFSQEFNFCNRTIIWHRDVAQNFEKYLRKDFSGKIFFEMAGLLDYFSDQKARNLFSRLSSWMRAGDVFCVANIIPNRERPFIEKVIRWRGMRYRKSHNLLDLLESGGFARSDIEMEIDATGIYTVASITKKGGGKKVLNLYHNARCFFTPVAISNQKFILISEGGFMGLLSGKRGLIFGVMNDRSLAWEIAKICHREGAELGFSCLGATTEKRVLTLANEVNSVFVAPCNVNHDEEIRSVFKKMAEHWAGVDFVVHSIAFVRKEELKGFYYETSRQGFLEAMDVTVFSFTAICREARPYMSDGGSLITLSYLGAERVIPQYNVMGVTKAALEASVRYLATDLGPSGIRVNAISVGPVPTRTMSTTIFSNFKEVLDWNRDNAPLRRNITAREVGETAMFLLSDKTSGITGEVLHVDAGYYIVGMKVQDNHNHRNPMEKKTSTP